MKAELRKLVDGLRDAGDAAKAAADRAAFRAWADVAEALLARAEEKPLSALAGGADAPCCPRCGYSGAEDPEQAAREPADVATTIYRSLGCVCQWEPGDSPCSVHDRFCEDHRAEGKEPTT